MITIPLIRNTRQGKAVKGTLLLPFSQRPVYTSENADRDVTIHTLENSDFLIPAGSYPLDLTFSPKFKKQLPIIENVPEREGIRIHRGSIPEHSKGCVLVDMFGQAALEAFINRLKFNYDEEITICISDAFGANGGGCEQ